MARHISTIVIAVVIGAPLTIFVSANSMGLAHSGMGGLISMLVAPGLLVGLIPNLSDLGFEVLFILVQAIYYIVVALILKAAFRKFFFEPEQRDAG